MPRQCYIGTFWKRQHLYNNCSAYRSPPSSPTRGLHNITITKTNTRCYNIILLLFMRVRQAEIRVSGEIRLLLLYRFIYIYIYIFCFQSLNPVVRIFSFCF